MKTVSKKLLSLLLVAMLLVSAVPQAFAAEAIIRFGLKIVATVDGETQTVTIPTGASSENEYKSWAEIPVEDILAVALAALVAEGLGHGQAREGHRATSSGGLVHLTEDMAVLLITPDSVISLYRSLPSRVRSPTPVNTE